MSFWGTLAGIGTSLIPGVGPFIAPLVGGAINGLTGGGSKDGAVTGSQQYSPEVQALLKRINAPGASGDNTAQDTAQNYYKTVLSGDQESTRSLLGPDVDTILGQYDNAAKAAANLGPRGAGRTQLMAEAPFQKAGAYGKLLAGAKSTAAQGLTTIGGQKAAEITGRRGQDVGLLGSLTGAQSQQDRLAFEKQQEKDKQYKDLGTGIGGFLTNLLNGKGGKGGTTPSYDPSNAGSNLSSYDEFS